MACSRILPPRVSCPDDSTFATSTTSLYAPHCINVYLMRFVQHNARLRHGNSFSGSRRKCPTFLSTCSQSIAALICRSSRRGITARNQLAPQAQDIAFWHISKCRSLRYLSQTTPFGIGIMNCRRSNSVRFQDSFQLKERWQESLQSP